jgi:hypothetical protein
METRGARPRSMRLTDELDVAAAFATDLWLRPAPSRAFRASRPMSTSSSRARRLPRSAGPSLDATLRSWRGRLIPGCTQPSNHLMSGPGRPAPVTRVCTGWALWPPAIRQGAALCHGMHRVTAERLFRSPDARRSRAVRPRRSQWSPGAHAPTRPSAGTPQAGRRHAMGRAQRRGSPGPADPGTRPPVAAAMTAALPARGPGTWPTRQRARPVPP